MSRRRRPSKRLRRAYLKRWPTSVAPGGFAEYNMRAKGVAVDEARLNQYIVNKLFDLESTNARLNAGPHLPGEIYTRNPGTQVIDEGPVRKIRALIDTPIERSVCLRRSKRHSISLFFNEDLSVCYFIETNGITVRRSLNFSSRERAMNAYNSGTLAQSWQPSTLLTTPG